MSERRPLAGKRVLITRAPHQAGRLAEALEEAGAETLGLPTIAIAPPESYAPLDHALATIENFDWLILTSANAAQALAGRAQALAIPPAGLRRAKVAAIGSATAKAAREIGLTVDVVPTEYVAEAVVAALEDKIAGKRVLLARAAVARDVIPKELRRLGAEVLDVAVYQTLLPADSIRQVRALLGEGEPLPDAVTFTSSSTVRNFLALLQAAELDRPARLPAVSIGPITTRTLRDCNWEPAAQAAEASIPGLVEACIGLLAARETQ